MSEPTDLTVSWESLTPPFLPEQLLFDPARQTPVLLTRGAGLRQNELWSWDGQRFHREVDCLFPDQPPGAVRALFAVVDPEAQGLRVFGRIDNAVVEVPGDAIHFPGGDGAESAPKIFTACLLGTTLLFLAGDGAVFTRDGDALALVHEPVAGMRDRNGALQHAVTDPVHNQIAAVSKRGTRYAFTAGNGWTKIDDTGINEMSLAWHPRAARVEMLRGEPSEDEFGTSRMWLQGWPDELSSPEETQRCVPFGRRRPLVFDEFRDQWLLLDLGVYRAKVHTCAPGGAWSEIEQPCYLGPHYHQCFSWTSGGPLRAVNELSGASAILTGDRWEPAADADDSDGDGLSSAVVDGFVRLDSSGALHHFPDRGEPARLASPWGGLDTSDSADGAVLCHDPHADRLVLLTGEDGRGWTFRNGSWTEHTTKPPAAPGVLCATENGVYCFADGELWLLTPDDSWALVGADPDWSAHLLVATGRDTALWSVSDRHVGYWASDGFQPVVALPEPVSLTGDEADRVATHLVASTVTYDPVGDRLLILGPSGTWALPLAGLAPADAALPQPAAVPAEVPAAADDLPAQQSCYLLEFSIAPGGYRFALVHVHATLSETLAALDETLFAPDPDEREEAEELLFEGATLHLWVVQRGMLTQGIDLRRFLQTGDEEGDRLLARLFQLHGRLDRVGPGEAGIWDELNDVRAQVIDLARSLSLDTGALAAEVPPLTAPVLDSDGGDGYVTVSWQGPRPDPDTFSYLADGAALEEGANYLE